MWAWEGLLPVLIAMLFAAAIVDYFLRTYAITRRISVGDMKVEATSMEDARALMELLENYSKEK
jgi:hypothetical protein